MLRVMIVDDSEEDSHRRSLYLRLMLEQIGYTVVAEIFELRKIYEHATQREFVYQLHWRVDDLVMWDNRCTMHRGRAYDDRQYRRDMRRVTLSDSAPTLEQPI